MRLRIRRTLVVCLGIPTVVLTGSWLWLATDHGTLALWNTVVHEGGVHTLGQTVLYFSHFLREVPTLLAYVLFLLAAGGGMARGGAGVQPGTRRANLRAGILVGMAAILIIFAFVAAADQAGAESALLDLLQYRTRDDTVGYGTHWRYHWLSTVWFGAILHSAPPLLNRLIGATVLVPDRRWRRAAWLTFGCVTVVFGISPDIFTDPRYIGHQAREILTHAATSLLLGTGILLLAGSRTAGLARRSSSLRLSWWSTVPTILIPVYLGAAGLLGDAMAQGQTEYGLGAMVAAHYFEHTLDYLLVMLLLSGGLLLVRPPSRGPEHVQHLTTA